MRRLLSTLLLCVSLFPAALSAQEGPGPDGEGMDAARAAFLEGRYRDVEEHLGVLLRSGTLEAGLKAEAQGLLERASAWRMVTGPLHRESLDSGPELLAAEGEWAVLRPLVEEVLQGTVVAFPGPMSKAPVFRVVILPEAEQFAVVSDLGVADVLGAGVRGVTLARTLFVLSPSAEVAGYDWQRVLAHELLHFLAHNLAQGALPIWFEEGLAWSLDDLWRGNPVRKPDAVDRGLLGLAVRSRKLLDWDRLEESFGRAGEPREARLAFTQAALAVRVVVDRGGVDALWAICEGVGAGRSFEEVLEEVADYKLERLRQRASTVWTRGSSREDMNAARILFEVETAPEGIAATDRIHLADLLWGRGKALAALRVLEGIDDDGIRATGSWALRGARLYLETGRPEAALEAVDRALAIAGDDGQLLLVRALAYETLGREQEAWDVMARVHRLQPFASDVRAHLMRLRGGRDEHDR
jgi:tetratricopeptide (TPR) repeat protein